MKKKSSHISTVIILTTVIFLVAEAQAENESTTKQNEVVTPAQFRPSPLDRRPSFWTKTANNLRQSTLLRMQRPFNRTFLQRRYSQVENNNIQPISEPTIEQPRRRRIKVRYNPEQTTEETSTEGSTTEKSKEDDLETKIMKDESFIGLKDFAAQLINETTAYFTKKQSQGRSYPVEEPLPPQHQLWDDKDQTYHASTFATAEYEPSAYHHHFIPPPTVHYLPPQKKDDYLFTKFAMIALLKLILAKLKAIGFMKLMLLFFLKIPILFFKFLFILKGFKLLKLVSIPFIMASFAAPFLPLLPFFIPLLFFPMLLFPFFLPLLLPLLFFLPIVPVTTPGTAAATTNVGRRKRSLVDESNLISNRTWTVMDEKWKNQQNSTNSRARYFRTRVRPATFEHRRNDYRNEYDYYNKYNQYEQPEQSENLIELTQKVVESQHCLERVACELASHNESKIYQAAIIW